MTLPFKISLSFDIDNYETEVSSELCPLDINGVDIINSVIQNLIYEFNSDFYDVIFDDDINLDSNIKIKIEFDSEIYYYTLNTYYIREDEIDSDLSRDLYYDLEYLF